MNKQTTFSLVSDELLQAKTNKTAFLDEINRIIPWSEWIKIVKPCYDRGERENKPFDLELMLRI